MSVLAFTVYGVPIPKGSTKAFIPKGWTRPIITNDNAKTKPWQEAVTSAALEARAGERPIEDPVVLALRFFLPRPMSAPRRVLEPAKKPDLDKLVRAVKDGLTRGGVYRDDAQVIRLEASKEFAAGPKDPDGTAGVPRVVIEVGLSADAPKLRDHATEQKRLDWAEAGEYTGERSRP